ncbi:hypothetical protein LZZ85_10500 [Terrimonas sp. NA20]|uniref:Uncharacterized protein n=1 Tax=Terrimonas ginsenosidimutans TaxID=2908004 RepID=A0ABS9KR02_9BACT|nr:hypothetical protein [Terrimonas ginsenosidimutans]MCG2614714.1 hypothetical protein [Terrimonas ginsenosidimutans]
MNDSPKIQLSRFEEQLVTDSSWLLTKNAVLEKIKLMLASLQDGQNEILLGVKDRLPAEVLQPSPKISRGENYLGLPWMVLDHPRYFDRDNLFAVRTMFWWGNFFSTTLLLSGRHKDRYRERIADEWDMLRNDEFYISHNLSAWDHHFENDNYTALREMDELQFRQHLQTHSFIKLAKKISLENWDTLDISLLANFNRLIKTIA